MEETLVKEDLDPKLVAEFLTWLGKKEKKAEASSPYSDIRCQDCGHYRDHCTTFSIDCINSKSKYMYVSTREWAKLLAAIDKPSTPLLEPVEELEIDTQE